MSALMNHVFLCLAIEQNVILFMKLLDLTVFLWHIERVKTTSNQLKLTYEIIQKLRLKKRIQKKIKAAQ